MTSQKSSVAKDVFAYLFTFVMLYIGIIYFIQLVWQIIEVQFPDVASFRWMNPFDSIRSSIAGLIIVWPVFLLMSRYLARDLVRHTHKAELWVRKWLIYLTIFVASITIIVDLILLINSFLGGELTIRFALKVVTILLVAAGVLGYEFWELKREPTKGMPQMRAMALGSLVLVVLAIVGGFVFVGSPSVSRAYRLDEERASDLSDIQYRLVQYWNKKGSLPDALPSLVDPLTGYTLPSDPESGAAYEYTKTGDLTFSLCASFAKETPSWTKTAGLRGMPMMDAWGQTENWDHMAGHVCFDRTIDPELHKELY